MTDATTRDLIPHPTTPGDVRIDVAVARAGASLRVRYRLDGDVARLRVPPLGPIRRGERLWETTCFELFLRAAGASAYHEVNLAPSRAWDLHVFRGYRDGGPLPAVAVAPQITVAVEATHVALDAELRLDTLDAAYPHAPLVLAVSSVIETTDGRCSYWALAHPADRPDFHHEGAFVWSLAPPA